jgi:hypothetical protein
MKEEKFLLGYSCLFNALECCTWWNQLNTPFHRVTRGDFLQYRVTSDAPFGITTKYSYLRRGRLFIPPAHTIPHHDLTRLDQTINAHRRRHYALPRDRPQRRAPVASKIRTCLLRAGHQARAAVHTQRSQRRHHGAQNVVFDSAAVPAVAGPHQRGVVAGPGTRPWKRRGPGGAGFVGRGRVGEATRTWGPGGPHLCHRWRGNL